MIGFVRLAIVGIIGLTAIYFIVSLYSRSVRREKLEKRWDAAHENAPLGADDPARNAYIEDGMASYEGSLRKKLILLIFVLPVVAVIALVYLNNFS
ncbi:hypothetical protein DI396_11650 [Litorivita pollutaquae]|uniref:Cation/multidrug efflux pump n=1 Tax=Litorivita pollutaquae TaxID=2200892 RepID=A0A2V4NAP0_9RHOB|nr:hypothetical protein [Litorivita pollutaquae]PYC47203.1 hypothetical protein DI396_11650 [Litorivita pollutaquae]